MMYLADAPVGGKHNNGRQTGLQGSVEVGEALDVQHMHLVYEQHAWNELGHSLVYVLVHHLQCAYAMLSLRATRNPRTTEYRGLRPSLVHHL